MQYSTEVINTRFGLGWLFVCLIMGGCSDPPTSPPFTVEEAFTKDQLIPISAGSTWDYEGIGPQVDMMLIDLLAVDTVRRFEEERTYLSDSQSDPGSFTGMMIWYRCVSASGSSNLIGFSIANTGLLLGSPKGYNDAPDLFRGYYVVSRGQVLPKHPVMNDTLLLSDRAYLWRGIETVTTAAGTFDSCYKVEDLATHKERAWLKRGVGLVRAEYGEPDSLAAYTLSLRSYTIK
jgi:hypothetical protein